WNTSNGLFMRVLEADNTLGAVVNLEGSTQWDLAIRGNTLTLLYGTGNDALYIRSYDLGTNTFTGPAVLATENAANDYDHPNLRYKSDGSLVAIFGRDNYPQHIYRKTFDADLLAQINETLVYQQNSSLNCIDVSTNASDEILISTKWGVNGTDVFQAWILDANGGTLMGTTGIFSSSVRVLHQRMHAVRQRRFRDRDAHVAQLQRRRRLQVRASTPATTTSRTAACKC
ncbi:MAG: hypothetical protein IPF41_16175, partial [Flavobacteriales bacterium]|nr:hypothetical protein [Flavobacteriales bacterium]